MANGDRGVIRVPVTSPWQTVTLIPSSDIAKLWPDLDYRDFAMWELNLSAVSTGDKVVGYFDYLRFDRTVSGQAQFTEQAQMQAAFASKYPNVKQQQALEVSRNLPHVNWFGPQVTVPTYSGIPKSQYQAFLQNTVIPQIHNSGGLASYNHPYGYSDLAAQSQSQQNTLLSQVASSLLANHVLGADLLEVGYILRQGVDVNHHIGLWDVLSRNAVFLTGNGVSDDHVGNNWYGFHNNWFTSVWAASTQMADLLAALAAGRAWCGSLSKFRGTLDLLVDGSVPMGAASVSSVTSRKLAATATGLPSGAVLQVLQGAVDYAGQNAPTDDVKLIGTYTPVQLASGQITQAVSTTQDSFLRAQSSLPPARPSPPPTRSGCCASPRQRHPRCPGGLTSTFVPRRACGLGTSRGNGTGRGHPLAVACVQASARLCAEARPGLFRRTWGPSWRPHAGRLSAAYAPKASERLPLQASKASAGYPRPPDDAFNRAEQRASACGLGTKAPADHDGPLARLLTK